MSIDSSLENLLSREVSYTVNSSLNAGHERLDDTEYTHLFKMTKDILMKIKNQTKEFSY